ncbi:undecaprenyl-diphosphatase [Rhizobium sp. BK609]|nr:undecaprenyl-diphosphatase [Rhizobium sp. BK098]MBB3618348.1 undecaprenyl-diphosphatase [Rhizobium sp. BK609]MBB3684005.1 undecaprenyl-diphosphatase [Rhizobium sp. BK612]
MYGDNQTGNAATLVRIAAAICLSIACSLAVGVMSGQTWAFDNEVLLALRKSADTQLPVGPTWLPDIMIILTTFGSSAVTGSVAAVFAMFLVANAAYREAAFIVLLFGGAELLGNGIKPLIGRARPDVISHLVAAGGQSFPSGHSTLSSAVYLGLALLFASRLQSTAGRRAFLGLAILITGLVGFSRIFLGVHFPTDVIGGWSIGAGWSLLLWSLWMRNEPQASSKE